MIQLIKKGGLRERANRSRKYHGSENTEATLRSNRIYQPNHLDKTENTTATEIPNEKSSNLALDDIKESD
ncbi:hypothetical protein HX122_09495 [Acinetobacter towneri]|uniref:hypothetical protein n=1 Tax=Acinetobacter towneri TaxID=202956 RepID=UPI002577523D|nr:hypothetical protein [Acinetobacter towneri]MDM1755205.1 hypothetical protein [Acinetobacter towneri]